MKLRAPRPSPSRALVRIADANANRAREGLRVVEDLLRLALADGGSSGSIKSIRLAVTRACEGSGWGRDVLLAARDADGDPGSRREAGRRLVRKGFAGLAAANFRRAQESLRVLEEMDRLAGGGGRRFRRLRFQTYQAEAKFVPLLSRISSG